jgi:hypothetical protein
VIGRRLLLAATARQTAQAAQLTPAYAASVAYLSYPLGSRWMEIGRGRAAMGREYTAAYQVPAPRADCAFAAWLRRDPPPAHGRAWPGPTGPRRVTQPVLFALPPGPLECPPRATAGGRLLPFAVPLLAPRLRLLPGLFLRLSQPHGQLDCVSWRRHLFRCVSDTTLALPPLPLR